jgi:homoserine O-succinyltransferase
VTPLRIGIVNLMPRAQTYEDLLLAALERAGVPLAVTWLRLTTPHYASSDRARIEQVYLPLSAAIEERLLDGLIISGAPVEDLPYETVIYWNELSGLLERARHVVPSTLGLCWGGLALARLLGIDKTLFERKLFGVYTLSAPDPNHPLMRELAPEFPCPQSRYSGLATADVERAVAAGSVRVLAGSEAAGWVIVESSDRRFVMHTGHPEYSAERLMFEYRRDLEARVTTVDAPHDFDVTQPTETWRSASASFLRAWLSSLRD